MSDWKPIETAPKDNINMQEELTLQDIHDLMHKMKSDLNLKKVDFLLSTDGEFIVTNRDKEDKWVRSGYHTKVEKNHLFLQIFITVNCKFFTKLYAEVYIPVDCTKADIVKRHITPVICSLEQKLEEDKP